MRGSTLLFFIPQLWCLCMASVISADIPGSDAVENLRIIENLNAMSPNFQWLYDSIIELFDPSLAAIDDHDLGKRDMLTDNLESILLAVNNSGIVIDILHEIADSTEQMNTLSNWLFQALLSIKSNSAIKGLNVTVNTTDIFAQVKASGLILSTIHELFFDDQQRDYFADSVGALLTRYVWIPRIVYDIGYNGKITVNRIADLVQNTKTKNPNPETNGTVEASVKPLLKREFYSLQERADNSTGAYSGSLQAFFNNLIQAGLMSSLAESSLSSILTAVNNSGIVAPIVQAAVRDVKIQKMAFFIVNKLYNFGVFDSIPINDYFQEFKTSGAASRSVQFGFGNPTYSPIIARIFERLENRGVFETIKLNLWGP